MDAWLKVAVSGAGGRMGREVVQAVLEADDLILSGAADPVFENRIISEALGLDSPIRIESNLGGVLEFGKIDSVVVFSLPAVVMDDIRTAMNAGAVPVVGTTGITPENLDEIRELAKKNGVGAIIAPNFAIGAILMMRTASEIAKYLPAVEIIELHHDKKLDSPSGTSIKTAEMIAAARDCAPKSAGNTSDAARGETVQGIQIHSVRLPGLIAHQEVIFGGPGQTLTIRHDSYDRKGFMPGVLLALRKSRGLKDVIYGLENII